MKKPRINLGHAAIPLALLTSCSSDGPLPGDNIVEKDEVRYLSVSISSVGQGGTRADETGGTGTTDTPGEGTGTTESGSSGTGGFQYGEQSESNAVNLYFVFFDDDGNFVTAQNMPVANLITGSPDENIPNVTDKHEGVVPVEINKGMTNPTQMLCFVNPVYSPGLNKSLVELEVTPRKSFYGNSKPDGGFAMSNAAYYDNDKNLKRTVDVNNKFFETAEQATNALAPDGDEALKQRVVDVYVERYAAKVKFSYNKGSNDDFQESFDITLGSSTASSAEAGATPSYKLLFIPDFWGVNATNTETFVSKSFRSLAPGGGMAGNNISYDGLDNILNDGATPTKKWLWNDPDNFRCYWGCSPAYFNTSYPEVASDVKDAEEKYKINYLLPSEMMSNFTDGNLNKEDGKDYDVEYVMESTIGTVALAQSNNPAAAIPSVVLHGHYKLIDTGNNDAGITDEGGKGITFYTVNMGENKREIYFDYDSNGESKAKSGDNVIGESILNYLIRTNPTMKMKVVGIESDKSYPDGVEKGDYVDVSLQAAAYLGKVDHPSLEALQGIKLAARKVCFQLKNEDGNNGNISSEGQLIYTDGDGVKYVFCVAASDGSYYHEVGNPETTFVKPTNTGKESTPEYINRLSILDANHKFVELRGDIMPEAYKDGATWYNIPVYHLGYYAKKGTPSDKVDNLDFADAKVGDFGLVRNHVYHIEVTGVTGLGIGILDPEDPILPPAETNTKAVAYRINIENWAVVPTHQVTL